MKIKLMLGFLFLVLFSGCNDVAISVVDEPVITQEYLENCALGNEPECFMVLKFGANPDVKLAWETIWYSGGLYPYMTTARLLNVSSSSPSDTAAGIGARKVLIQGLNENYTLQEEFITLSGTTKVSSTKKYIRFFRSYVNNTGSNGAAVGTISIRSLNIVRGTIPIENSISHGQTLMGIYTIPSGYVGAITMKTASSGQNEDANVNFMTRNFGSNVWRTKEHSDIYQNTWLVQNKILEIECEKTDIEFRAYSTGAGAGAGAEIHVEMQIFMINKSLVPNLCN